jgi:hypothetical protein
VYLALYGPEGSVIFDHPYIAESALQAHQVQASHRVPISTIPAQASPSAESGLTGPGLRKLAEVSVKATARSLRPESLPAKTRRQPASARCVRYRRAERSGRRR